MDTETAPDEKAKRIRTYQDCIELLSAELPTNGPDWQHDESDLRTVIGSLVRILRRRGARLTPAA